MTVEFTEGMDGSHAKKSGKGDTQDDECDHQYPLLKVHIVACHTGAVLFLPLKLKVADENRIPFLHTGFLQRSIHAQFFDQALEAA